MQTKQQIEKLLASAGVSPNKRLGQNFLIDLNLMRVLIDEAGIRSNDIVLEVGCGTGSFTEAICSQAGTVIAVEYDTALAKIAQAMLVDIYNVDVIHTDVLESKNRLSNEVVRAVTAAIADYSGRLMLVANLPYSVAASLMANLVTGSEGTPIADCMYTTVQLEVAERMVASTSDKSYGTLSILMAATGKAKILRKLPRTVFWPKPEVTSAMVSFVRDKKKVSRIHNMGVFREVVRLFMGHRRKMLQGCVKFAEGNLEKVHNWNAIFSRAFVEPHHRGEELEATEYISIANLCYEQIH